MVLSFIDDSWLSEQTAYRFESNGNMYLKIVEWIRNNEEMVESFPADGDNHNLMYTMHTYD